MKMKCEVTLFDYINFYSGSSHCILRWFFLRNKSTQGKKGGQVPDKYNHDNHISNLFG
jgi:hypothetical protein